MKTSFFIKFFSTNIFLPLFCLLANNTFSQSSLKIDSVVVSSDRQSSNRQDTSYLGIKFEKDLSWNQVKEKAKQENKYVFMDCFATWCGPCKKMDKEIYPNEKLGALVNEKFIAVKVQMDRTKNDNLPIQKWYTTVDEINRKFIISGYPAYLFFSPEGELVHQDEGYKSVVDFIALVNDVFNPSTQFAKIMEQFKIGKISADLLGKAALAAKKLGEKDLADSIARRYKVDYLNKLNDRFLFTRGNIKFVTQDFYSLFYEDGSKGRFFDFFFQHPNEVDSLFSGGFAELYIKAVITDEEINRKLLINKSPVTLTPDWESIRHDIGLKYGNYYAEKVISDYQPTFYRYIGNWQKWADIFEEKFKNKSLQKGGKHLGDYSDDWILNSNAWTVFKNCNDRIVLLQALKWSELAIKLIGQGDGIDGYLDTKANLLYKLGKCKQAIMLERKALQLNNEFAQKEGKEKGTFFEEFSGNIKKMEAGVPTWRVN